MALFALMVFHNKELKTERLASDAVCIIVDSTAEFRIKYSS